MSAPLPSADKSKAPTAGVTFLRTFVFDAAEGSGRELLSRFGAYGCFVDVHPETGPFRQRDVSIDRAINPGTGNKTVGHGRRPRSAKGRKSSVMIKFGRQAEAWTVAESAMVVEL